MNFDAFSKLPDEIKPTLMRLFVSGLLFWSGLASLFPTLPLYFKDLGYRPFQIGLVMAGFAVGVLVSRPALGRMSDLRSRRLVLLIGMGAMGIAPLGYLVIKSVWLLLPVRIFHGISWAAFASAYLMLVADITPKVHRGEIIGYMSLEQPLGLSLGPAIGGVLLEVTGYPAVFLLASVFGVCAFVLAYQIPEGKIPRHAGIKSLNQAFWPMLFDPRIRTPAIVMILVGISQAAINIFAPLYIRAMKVGFNPGLFFTAIAVTTFLIRFLSGVVGDRWGRGVFITYSLACSSLAMGLLWASCAAPVVLLAALLQGAGFGILIPITAALIADRVECHERGRAFSLSLMGLDVGLALGGSLLGGIAEVTGYQNLFAITTGLLLLSLIIFVTCSCKNTAQSVRFALGQGPDDYALSSPEQF